MRYVPTDEFAPVLRRLIASEDPERYSIVEERAGIGTDTIDSILRERREGCDFDLADRLLCALGAQHLWWGELAHIYYAIDLGFYDKDLERRVHVCSKGHVTMPKVDSKGHTYCLECANASTRRYRARRRARELAGREEARAA